MTIGLLEWEWQIPFPNFRNGNESGKFHSQFPGTGTDMKIPFPIFGNGNASGKFHSQFSGTGMQVEFHSQFSGTGMRVENSVPYFRERECEWKIPFPIFRNGNWRPVFPGMTGNGNSRSPLQNIMPLFLPVRPSPNFSNVPRTSKSENPKRAQLKESDLKIYL